MNPKIYKPEERVPQEIIDRIRENEECFEQILSNGSEGFVGDVGTLPHFSTFSRLFLHRSISLIYCFLPLLKLAYTFTQYQFSAPLFAPRLFLTDSSPSTPNFSIRLKAVIAERLTSSAISR